MLEGPPSKGALWKARKDFSAPWTDAMRQTKIEQLPGRWSTAHVAMQAVQEIANAV
jgi:hypothetical protein